jgi:hypothetical protein
MENPNAAADSSSDTYPDYNVKLDAERLHEIIERRDKEREAAAEERRAGRPLGKLASGLVKNLRSCNVLQLKRAKKLCDRYIKDHRKPPDAYDCGKPYILKVLESVTVKNCRYQLEFRRTTQQAKQVYVGHPVVWVYWRDGSIIRRRYIKKDKYLRQNLPRKVWGTFKGHFDNPKTEMLRQKLIEQVRSSLPD